MAMREVEWRDLEGRRWVSLLPDNLPDSMAREGLRLGPISLAPMGLALKHEVMLHNELVSRHILTLADALNNRQTVEGAVRSVIRAGAHEIIECFREASA